MSTPAAHRAHARNAEGLGEFDVEWGWSRGKLAPGFTAVLRVKDEAPSLPWVLPGLLRAVSQVLVIDNGSTDGTPEVARDVARSVDADDRLEVTSYPFSVARCGIDHLETPADSVHSLAYYYNWSFSQVRTRYALKWDGDMVLTREGEQVFRDLAWQLEGMDAMVRIPWHALYVQSESVAYLESGRRHRDVFAWPNRSGYSFDKAFDWEVHLRRDDPVITLFHNVFFEVKWLAADEFDHWSDAQFERQASRRKLHEWNVFHDLRDGMLPSGVVRIDNDGEEHVIEAVRRRSADDWHALPPPSPVSD